jgi:rod shape-determining protein MreC
MTGVPGFLQRHRTGLAFAALVLFCLLSISISNRNLVLKPKEAGQSFFSLFQVAFNGVANWVSGTWSALGELKRLRLELAETREKLAEYQRASRDLQAMRQENQALRAQLGFAESLTYRYLPARLVAKDPGNLFSTMVLDRGSRQGVRPGMPVVAFQGGLQGLVGRVVSAGLATCTVQPITDPDSYVAARLAGSRFDGLISGGTAERLVMSYVTKMALQEVQYGELVVTSGLGQVFPEGVHIGRVREMQAKGYEASLELQVEPIVDFGRLEYVFILDVGHNE